MKTAAPPFGQAGAVAYGPMLNTAAILLASQGNVPIETAAQLIDALLGASVSTGFVARAQARLAEILDAAEFDEAMKQALRAEPVLGADESPVNVVDNLDGGGQPATGAAHLVTVRTPDQRLVWYQAITSRSSGSLKDLGIFDRWYGVLVSDDYACYHQFDDQLAGVQKCVQHLLRHLRGVAELDEDNRLWADQVATALRDAGKLAQQAATTGAPVDAEARLIILWRSMRLRGWCRSYGVARRVTAGGGHAGGPDVASGWGRTRHIRGGSGAVWWHNRPVDRVVRATQGEGCGVRGDGACPPETARLDAGGAGRGCRPECAQHPQP